MLDALFAAICWVESQNNAQAVGDNGNAVGIVQMWKITVDDVNRIVGENRYTYEDRLDPAKCRAMFEIYVVHYGGKNATAETYARIWNGGPKGATKKSTLPYWNKVKAQLNKEEGK